jgi:energy-coupling factor transporter ATP-binding protein EcfA2
MNGTGKSSIARAIELHLKDKNLDELTQFKYLGSKDAADKPNISGIDSISSVRIFNEAFVNQFVFMKDEVLANSFDIFIKSPSYEAQFQKIEVLISGIKNTFKEDKAIDQVITDLSILSDSFGKSKSGYSEAGALAKGIVKGNKIAHIPKDLESYTDYLKCSVNSKWARWHLEGNSYLHISANCPFCTSPTAETKETILRFSKEYDSKTIEHLNNIINVLQRLGSYFSEEARKKIELITNNISGLSKEEINYLITLKGQIETLKSKLLDLKGISFYSLKDTEKVQDYFNTFKIDLNFLPDLKSKGTEEIIDKINNALKTVLNQVGQLQGEVGKQRSLIKKTIEENSEEINNFLKYAGYKYQVSIEYSNSSYQMKLRHLESAQSVPSGSQHLSFGERNAFALVLFMYDCLSKNPGLIILDDPISSFDKNKKYAVIDMLFRSDRCLRGRTVLMLTHDFEPIIDIFYTLSGDFQPMPCASFISSVNGVLNETPILKSDITTFSTICDEALKEEVSDVVKLVYLRRNYEIQNNKGMPYQILSSLLHKRPVPTKFTSTGEVNLTAAEVTEGTQAILTKLPTFDYSAMHAFLSDSSRMKDAYFKAKSNYAKIQIFRVTHGTFKDSAAITKFVNENFHIENDFIMQLNPIKYDLVPGHIIEECDKIMSQSPPPLA